MVALVLCRRSHLATVGTKRTEPGDRRDFGRIQSEPQQVPADDDLAIEPGSGSRHGIVATTLAEVASLSCAGS
ncbi:hypothetical protein GCM10027360_35800 [Amycolatopsis echigonensis]